MHNTYNKLGQTGETLTAVVLQFAAYASPFALSVSGIKKDNEVQNRIIYSHSN